MARFIRLNLMVHLIILVCPEKSGWLVSYVIHWFLNCRMELFVAQINEKGKRRDER